MWYLIGAIVCFLIGLRLSAFFSGSEIGFYRISALRLSIEAQGGDRPAQRMVWFLQRPADYVATILVGNNVANYLATASIGLALTVVPYEAVWLEILATLVVSPVIFFFGELLPKNLYYQAPWRLLRRENRLFMAFFYMFRVATLPLVAVTRLLERFSAVQDRQDAPVALGRSRLMQVFIQGHKEGVLTVTQHQFIDGLLASAGRHVEQSMMPLNRIIGVDANASVEAVVQHARRYGSAYVPVRQPGTEHEWFGYVATSEALLTRKPLAAIIRRMPVISPKTTWLEALLKLHDDGMHVALVKEGDKPVGIVFERGLSDRLIRPLPIKTHVSAFPIP